MLPFIAHAAEYCRTVRLFCPVVEPPQNVSVRFPSSPYMLPNNSSPQREIVQIQQKQAVTSIQNVS
jgi:hypothetical protein